MTTVEIVDLSKVITSGMHSHITTSIVPVMRIGDAAGKFDPPCEGFASNLLVMSDHCGTHLDDASAEFAEAGQECPALARLKPHLLEELASAFDP